jgi:hypothetical protein
MRQAVSYLKCRLSQQNPSHIISSTCCQQSNSPRQPGGTHALLSQNASPINTHTCAGNHNGRSAHAAHSCVAARGSQLLPFGGETRRAAAQLWGSGAGGGTSTQQPGQVSYRSGGGSSALLHLQCLHVQYYNVRSNAVPPGSRVAALEAEAIPEHTSRTQCT